MKKIYKKLTCLFILAVFISFSVPITASADTGPKPSVVINFENLGDTLCYATLLSKTPSTGPASAWDGDEDHIYLYNLSRDIWQAFQDYEDSDGFYFLQNGWQINETKKLAWTYYPPNVFKILLYFPETQTYAISNICERYACDTYYKVDMQGFTIGSADYDNNLINDDRISAQKAYEWKTEIISLIARIIITLAIEMAVALLFGFKNKKQLQLLIIVNSVTQVILNVLLNVLGLHVFKVSAIAIHFKAVYLILELLVFAIEAVIYSIFMKKVTDKPKPTYFYVLYALISNVLSFLIGLIIAIFIPAIF